MFANRAASTGYGQKFNSARDNGLQAYQDVMNGVDQRQNSLA